VVWKILALLLLAAPASAQPIVQPLAAPLQGPSANLGGLPLPAPMLPALAGPSATLAAPGTIAPSLLLPVPATVRPRLEVAAEALPQAPVLKAAPSATAAPAIGGPSKKETPPVLTTLDALAEGLTPARGERPSGEAGLSLGRAFDGGAAPVVSELPESAAWSLPDGGPLLRREPAGREYGGRRYVDFLNATALRLPVPGRAGRDFLWVRAIREGYTTRVAADGGVANEGYYSDTLLFKLKPDGGTEFIERTLESDPEYWTLLEDARVSSFRMRGRDPRTGKFRTEEVHLLGFTAYARHGGMDERTSRNAFVRLRVGADGVPRPERDEHGGLLIFFLSPEPVRLPGDGPARYASVDAKNGIVLTDARGRLRMHTRHRYQSGDPRLPEGFRPADYAEQSFPLNERFLQENTDWTALMAQSAQRETLRSDGLQEHYPKSALWPGSGKGHGPGAQPVRIQRRGSRLFVSEGWGRPWFDAGELSGPARAYLPDRGTRFLGFDHEIRFLDAAGKRKRVYTLAVKLWDQDLERIVGYHADAVQPQADYETWNPGVPDLWHVYPTGRIVLPDGRVDTYEGSADSNVVRRRWDLPRLLDEMASRARAVTP